MVYLIKAGEFIKVGYSKSESSFKSRLNSYHTSCPYEIEVLNLFEGGVSLERDILNYFLGFHMKGEWLKYDKSIEDFAKNPFPLLSSKIKKPTNNSHKIIINNLDFIIEEYRQGNSLKIIAEKYNITRERLTRYIPDELKRKKNGWFSLRRRETNPKNKKIMCTNTGEEFISIKEASRKLNITSTCIGKVCRGERKHTHNLIFKFVEPETTKNLLNSAMDDLSEAGNDIFE